MKHDDDGPAMHSVKWALVQTGQLSSARSVLNWPLPIISEGFPGKITSQTSEQEDPSSHHRRHSAKLTKLPCSQDLSQTELSDWNFGSAASKTTAQGRVLMAPCLQQKWAACVLASFFR
eukprot:1157984-Pelagomonas_calceolata.AAC.6